MKKTILFAAALIASVSAFAQPVQPVQALATPTAVSADKPADKAPEGFKFETVKEVPITSVKDQASSGTCWCYSGISFLESEILRATNGKVEDLDLAEMFVVYNSYADRAVKYVRLDGHLTFGQGSSFGDVLYTIKDHGIVPQEAMNGLNYGTERNQHAELAAGLKGYIEAIAKVPNKTLTTAWLDGYKGILNAYLGVAPEQFSYKGRSYTPQEYFKTLKIDLNDYVDLTSWTHLSYYEEHPVEVCDNWRWERAYNLPLDEMMAVIDNAIENGYTVAWAADVSEMGFTRNGIAVNPDPEVIEKSKAAGSDEAKWLGVTAGARKFNPKAPVKEMEVTPELRQKGYEEKSTTDDHGMHLFGIAKDQNGTKYYLVKNSWGTNSKYSGIWYVSESYVRYKTMDIMVNKDALPKDIKKKLNLK
jgi:aminopeptidase C